MLSTQVFEKQNAGSRDQSNEQARTGTQRVIMEWIAAHPREEAGKQKDGRSGNRARARARRTWSNETQKWITEDLEIERARTPPSTPRDGDEII